MQARWPHISRVYRYDPSEDLRPREPIFNRFPAVVLILSAVIIGTSTVLFMAQPYLEDWMLRAGAVVAGVGMFLTLENLEGIVLGAIL